MASLSEEEDETAVKFEPVDFPDDDKRHLTNKRDRTFGSDAFTLHEERNIRQKLDVGLSRNETMQRPGPGGCRLTYIEGWKVIHDANQIFGFNGWSSHIIALDLRFLDESSGRFHACVSATVRITLRDGAYREDRGGGSAENMRSKGEAILKAEKEAVTDATKRALKNFGLRLGLSLYDRQHVREMNKPQQAGVSGRAQMAPSGGMNTPQSIVKKMVHGSVNQVTPQVMAPATPTTTSASSGAAKGGMDSGGGGPISNGGASSVMHGQIAVKREQAIMRKQAFVRAKVVEDRAKMQRDNAPPAALRAQHGISMAKLPICAVQNARQANGSLQQQQQQQQQHGKGHARGNQFSPISPAPGMVGGHVYGAGRVGENFLAQIAQSEQRSNTKAGRRALQNGEYRPSSGGSAMGATTNHTKKISGDTKGCESGSKAIGTLNDGRVMRQKEIEEATRMAMAEF